MASDTDSLAKAVWEAYDRVRQDYAQKVLSVAPIVSKSQIEGILVK